MSTDRVERRLTAILAADVAGYSRLTGLDEEDTHARLQDHLRSLVDPKIAEHRGRVVKNAGDRLLAEFASVVDAVRCAVDVQRGMAQRNAELPQEKRIEFRIGINVGDIIIERDDFFGDGVNVAARLEAVAEPGAICLSEDAHRQVQGKLDVTFEDVGERQLKNIARPVRVFRVALARPAKPIWPWRNAVAVRRHSWRARVPTIGAVLVLTAGAGAAALYLHLGRPPLVSQMSGQLPNSSERFSMIVLPLGKDLGVRYALEGSVQPSGDRLRVHVQLIDTQSDTHLWTDQFDEDRADLLRMQDAIVTRIAHAIGVKMTAERARWAQTRAVNPGAEDLARRCQAAVTRSLSAYAIACSGSPRKL